MRRDIFGVFGHGEVHSLEEQLDWGRLDCDDGCRMLHSQGVLVRPENTDLAILLSEGLQAFVAMLAYVKCQ